MNKLCFLLLGVGVALSGCPRTTPQSPEVAAPRTSAGPAAPRIESSDAGGADSGADAAQAVLELPSPTDWRVRVPTGPCDPHRTNLARVEKSIVEGSRAEGRQKWPKWKRSVPPEYLERLLDRFVLTKAERATLGANAFVVSARLEQENYAHAFHELYQSQVPIYVSADAVFHALYRGTDVVLGNVEANVLEDLTRHVVHELRRALGESSKKYSAGIVNGLDVYLTVAESLLSGDLRPSAFGNDKRVAALVELARRAQGFATVELFGRRRVVDFSQLAPRGRYSVDRYGHTLGPYFRGAMWLSRFELNLVSRSSRSSAPGLVPDARETPEEALAAVALAELAVKADVDDDVAELDAAWRMMAGQREDVSLADLALLRAQMNAKTLSHPGAFDQLKSAVGSRFRRTTRMHWMPQGAAELPVIATLLGPRAVPDAAAVTRVVHDAVPFRHTAKAADVAYMLGHDRAKRYLQRDLRRYPGLLASLDAGRRDLEKPSPGLHGAWLEALRGLGKIPAGTPSFMKTEAFADLRLSSTVAGFAQLRHNNVLVAGQAYDAAGCEVPDGYVDPAVETYAALIEYTRRARTWMAKLGQDDAAAYFDRVEEVLRVLHAISVDELAGRTLSPEQRRWLSMIVEIVPGGSDFAARFEGWYFDLFPSIDEAFERPELIADFYTSSNLGAVGYVGARRPRLGFFVEDTGGAPRVMVGPVARGYEHVGSISRRLDDAAALRLKKVSEPWAKSYTPPAPAAPKLEVTLDERSFDDDTNGWVYSVRSRARGVVHIELLDHHRHVVGRGSARLVGGRALVTIPSTDAYAEAARIRLGEHTIWHYGPVQLRLLESDAETT